MCVPPSACIKITQAGVWHLWHLWNGQMPNAKCQMPNAKCQVPEGSAHIMLSQSECLLPGIVFNVCTPLCLHKNHPGRGMAPMASVERPNAKCQMPNAKCQMPNAKCHRAVHTYVVPVRVPLARHTFFFKCINITQTGVWHLWHLWNGQMPNAKCQMPNAKCQVPEGSAHVSCPSQSASCPAYFFF
jgi:hypothetical protein